MLNNAALWIRDTIASHIWQINLPVIDPSKKVYYAVDVDVETFPCSSYPEIGLFNGHVRLITGRPGFVGLPAQAYYEDGSENPYGWYEGILLDKKIGVSSQSIDVSVMGDVGTFSGFQFSISDCNKQWQYINKYSVQFTNKKITHYVVLDNIFYALWSGVVEDTEYNDEEIIFHCVSVFNSIHKPMPPRSAISPEFPETIENDSAKTIPIVIGDMANASLLLTNKTINYLDINGLSSNPYLVGFAEYDLPYPVTSWSEAYPALITYDKSFALDELKDKYLLVVAGGGNVKKNKMLRILGNQASYLSILPGPTTYQKYITKISIESLTDYDDIGNFGASYSLRFNDSVWIPYASDFLSTRWFAKILDFTMEYSFSNLAVSELLLNAEGLPIIRVWNEQAKQFDDISKLFLSSDLSAGTISMKPKVLTGEDSAQYNTFFKPEITSFKAGYINPDQLSLGVQYAGASAIVTGELADLTDKDRATYMSVFHPAMYQAFCGAVIEIKLTDNIINALGSGDTRLAIDVKIETDTTKGYYLNLMTCGIDIYGRQIQDDAGFGHKIQVGAGLPGYENVNTIDDEYYAAGGDNGEICHNNLIFNTADGYRFLYDTQLIGDNLIALIKSKVVDRLLLIVNINASDDTAPALQLDVKEVVFMQTSSVSIESDNVFVSVKGEKYSSYETNNVYRALQHILIDYDGVSSSDIDFGNLSTKRQSWNVGRQLTNRKSSLDYISELCRQSFVAYWQKRGGALGFSAWREDTTIRAFHNENIILRDSIRGIHRTRVSSLYNEFSILYAWSDVTNRYEKEFFITKIDEASFPLSSDATWKTYVGGLSDASYADAKALWEQCNAVYTKSRSVQKLTIECPWFVDLSQLPNYTGGGVGTGATAFKLLQNLVEWATWQKDIVQYDLSLTTETTQLELLQYVSFEDSHLTNSTALGGWIIGLSNNPEKNTRTVTVMLAPVLDEAEEDNLIIETGDSELIIETGSNTETIIEGA